MEEVSKDIEFIEQENKYLRMELSRISSVLKVENYLQLRNLEKAIEEKHPGFLKEYYSQWKTSEVL